MSPVRIGASELFGEEPQAPIGQGRTRIALSDIMGDVAQDENGEKSYSWSQAPIAAAANFLPSLGNAATDLYKGVTENPVEFAKSAAGFPLGMINRSMTPGPAPIAEQYFDPAVKGAARKLGVEPNHAAGGIDFDQETLKRNLAEDPAGTALSVAPFIPGEGMLNPLRPVAKGLTGAAKTVGKVTNKIEGSAAAAVTKTLNPRLASVNELPKTKDFEAKAKAIYDAAKAEGVNYNPVWYQRLTAGLEQHLRKEGYDPARHPDAARELALLNGKKGQLSLEALEQTRSEIGRKARDLRKANNTTDARQLELMQQYMDEFTDKPVQMGDVAGLKNPQRALELLESARGVYKQKIKSQKLDELHYQAELTAGANYTQSGLENALRRQFKNVLANKHERRGWNREELAAMDEVVNGGKISRSIGKLAPTGALSKTLVPGMGMVVGGGAGFLAGGPAGAAITGPALAAALPAAGAVARNIATKRTLGAAENVRGVVAGGRLAPVTHDATAGIATGLAAGTNARNQDRKKSLDFAEKTLGGPMLNHIKKTPHLRQLLHSWLSDRAAGRNGSGAQALAQAVAAEVNQPELAGRILQELTQ